MGLFSRPEYVRWVELHRIMANGNVHYVEGHANNVRTRHGVTTIHWYQDDALLLPNERIESINMGDWITTEDFNS